MPSNVETTDVLWWKYPGHPKKIRGLVRKKLGHIKKKQLQYKQGKGKLKTGRKLNYVRKEHKYNKLKKRRLK